MQLPPEISHHQGAVKRPHLVRQMDFLNGVFALRDKQDRILISRNDPYMKGGREKDCFHSWSSTRPSGDETTCTYFSIGTFEGGGGEGWMACRRLEQHWRGGFCLVLDDIGKKAGVPQLPPSWIVETSPGSWHFGYLFDQVVRDISEMTRLTRSAVQGGDPGAGGITRLMRFPTSVVGAGKRYGAKLLSWSPERRYPPGDALLKAMGVMPMTGRAVRRYEGGDPGVDADEVTRFYAGRGELGGRSATGFWEVPCFRGEEHSNGDEGMGYNPKNGAVSCLHSHKAEITRAAHTEWLLKNDGPDLREFVDES